MLAIEQLKLTDRDLAERLRKSMVEVESRLRAAAAQSPDSLVSQTAGYLLGAGGKRWRPLLVLLGAQFGDPERDSVLDAATVVELVHAASLYHDDVMDEAPLRHGVPSAHTHWNNKIAILAGDHLVARAATLSLDLDEQALFVDEGDVLTSAGLAAGMDLCLHVVRTDHGSEVANHVARYCVVPPWREGGQAQFIEQPVPKPAVDSTAPVRDWAPKRHRWTLPIATGLGV